MRLIQMASYFLEGRDRRGLGMIAKTEDGVTTLNYTGGDKIATITNRIEDGFTLTLHAYKGGYGCISHCNRLSAIFRALNSEWKDRRYTSFQRWGQARIWDGKLRLEMTLITDTSFSVKHNVVALDYAALERACLTDAEPQVVANTSPATNNSSEAINNLMALVATI